MMDKISIRQHIEYDGNSYYGRVDLGNNLNTDSLEKAKECLVFMVVSVNENWKIPIGYFLTSGLNSSQKFELVRHALDLLLETNVIITSLTYYGFSINLSMSKLLGCNFDVDNLNTKLTACSKNNANAEVVVLLDAAHMMKLIRNAFGE